MNNLKLKCIIALVILTLSTPLWGQKIKLKRANGLYGGIKGRERYDRLLGNVILTHQRAVIYCDSAYLFKSQNRFEAFGNVRITEGDSVRITALNLSYDGLTKTARLSENVIFKKKETLTLYTDLLYYYRGEGLVSYFEGGELVDSVNTLVSQRGYFDIQANRASFKKDVVGKNENYVLTADTLEYDIGSKIYFFHSTTTIEKKDEGTAVFEGGRYDTQKKKSMFSKGILNTPSYTIKANINLLDEENQLYKLRDHASITFKEEKIIVYGDTIDYNKATGIVEAYSNAYIIQYDDQKDSLFLRADTLLFMDKSDSVGQVLLAYHNVKFYRNNLQGIADSLAYNQKDSTLEFFNDPVIWSEGNQITGQSIRVFINDQSIDRILLPRDAFVVLQDSMSYFNQIKGRTMTAYVKENNIDYIDIEGNGESIYFIHEEPASNVLIGQESKLLGMNHMICGNMKIIFSRGNVDQVDFLVKPSATFIPPANLTRDNMTLEGFEWRGEERPDKETIVYKEYLSPPPR